MRTVIVSSLKMTAKTFAAMENELMGTNNLQEVYRGTKKLGYRFATGEVFTAKQLAEFFVLVYGPIQLKTKAYGATKILNGEA